MKQLVVFWSTDRQDNNRIMDPAFVTMSAAPLSRRAALRLAGLSVAATCLPRPAHALKPGKPSKEKLLGSLREEKTPEEIEADRLRVAEDKRIRLEKQRELQAAAERKKAGVEEASEPEMEIESNLRGQYYFPTARKRYLPRVKVAWDTLPDAEQAVRSNQWSEVAELEKQELRDALLPMRLYASSLAGQGLSISAKFIERMNSQADSYEGALKKLAKAAKKKETPVALETLSVMKDAISKYRQFGHLESDDFGIGEIPKDARVGSGFGNNNTALYRRNRSVQREVTGG